MNNHRGQASILIAIIFQVLFVFFAMVVNVGLLVHDKINLQNSVDIAAYYGAMKQAEVLNAMAQINYQIRQSWKLFAWRLWVLGDAGRNIDFLSGNVKEPPDDATSWPVGAKFPGPIVCVRNGFWKNDPKDSSGNPENLCKDNLSISALPPLNLTGAQLLPIFAPFFDIFVNQTQANHDAFVADFALSGVTDYSLAIQFLASYKIAVAHRRFAIHHLQGLLTHQGPNDLLDLNGMSVAKTVQNTLMKNLTAANKASVTNFSFTNSLGGNPFMVPEDVRAFVTYLDFSKGGGSQTSTPQQINIQSAQDTPNSQMYTDAQIFFQSDYLGTRDSESAASFDQETEDFTTDLKAYYSLVGFEKNPWIMAYVSVQASTTPKMLFSPISSDSTPITLTAEAYAMPFGGKMGPWYYNSWPQGASESTGDTQLDTLLPPRMDADVQKVTVFPNYSRYPGDQIGLSSRLARYEGLKNIGVPLLPSWQDYNYVANINSDPIVFLEATPTTIPVTRNIEIAAIAPDLFDAAYYSVNYEWGTRLNQNAQSVFTNMCQGSCFNLGSTLFPTPSNTEVVFQAQQKDALMQDASWIIPSAQIQTVNTSWSQGNPGEYDGNQAAISAGQTWENFSGDKPAGGRVGYSVKVVSKAFLQENNLPLGGQGNSAGPIANPPQ